MDENKPQQNSKGNIKTVKTYLSDMADLVRENEISVIKIALAEQNKHAREDLYRQAESSPSKKLFWAIGGIVLVVLSIFGVYYFMQLKAQRDMPQQLIKEEFIISYDERSDIEPLTPDSLINKLSSIKQEKSVSKGNDVIKLISIKKDVNGTKENILIKDLFTLLRFTAPLSLTRSLSDNYMVGTYIKNGTAEVTTVDGRPALFMIFQTKDYSLTYAGMLEWERTITNDLFSIFLFDTKENRLELSKRGWRDIIINNKDVRVLFNENSLPILYYLFADKNNLIITDSKDAIKEIVGRLIIKNIKPL